MPEIVRTPLFRPIGAESLHILIEAAKHLNEGIAADPLVGLMSSGLLALICLKKGWIAFKMLKAWVNTKCGERDEGDQT